MARLDFADGWWFELTPVAYQFPEADNAEKRAWDDTANWIRIDFATEVDGQRWEARRDSWFLTWELRGLVTWCRATAEGRSPAAAFDTLEPHLMLSVSSREGRITRIAVEFGVLDDFTFWGWQWAGDSESVVMEHDVTRKRLTEFAEALERELQPFPVR